MSSHPSTNPVDPQDDLHCVSPSAFVDGMDSRDTRTTMNTLPRDILPLIFIHCILPPCLSLSAEQLDFMREEDSPTAKLRPVLLTCKVWYAIAIDAPSLWCDLNSSWARMTPELLQRSKNAPLNLCWNSNTLVPLGCDLRAHLGMIFQQAATRLVNIQMDIAAAHLASVLHELDKPGFRPQVCELQVYDDEDRILFPRHILENIAESVQDLVLKYMAIELPHVPFPCLTRLDLCLEALYDHPEKRYTTTDIWKMLLGMPRLASFRMHVMHPDHTFSDTHPMALANDIDDIRHPSLRAMVFTGCKLEHPIHNLARLLSRSSMSQLSIDSHRSHRTTAPELESESRNDLGRFLRAISIPLASLRPRELSLTRNWGGSRHIAELAMAEPISSLTVSDATDAAYRPEHTARGSYIPSLLFEAVASSHELSRDIQRVNIDAGFLPLLTRLLDPRGHPQNGNGGPNGGFDGARSTSGEASSAAPGASLPLPNLRSLTLSLRDWNSMAGDTDSTTVLLSNLHDLTELLAHRRAKSRDGGSQDSRIRIHDNEGGQWEYFTLIVDCDFELWNVVQPVVAKLRDQVDFCDIRIGPDYRTDPGSDETDDDPADMVA